MGSLAFKGGSYYGIFSKGGKKKWLKIGRVDKKQAKKILRQLELEYSRDRLNLSLPVDLTLNQYLEKYFNYTKTNKANSTYTIELEITKAIKNYFGDIDLFKIDSLAVESYKSYRKSLGRKSATINKGLSVLRFMLNKALEWGYIDKTPKFKLLKVPKSPPKYLTVEEIQRLIDYSSNWLKPILVILRNTGMRIGELLNIKFTDIDMANRTVTVSSSKTNDYRIIPMNKELCTLLRLLHAHYIDPRTQTVIPRSSKQMVYLICYPDGKRIKSIRTSFNKACKYAGIKATPHTLRHTFASHLIMNGADLVTVKELLGHTQISTTIIYSHVSEDHLARGVEKLKW